MGALKKEAIWHAHTHYAIYRKNTPTTTPEQEKFAMQLAVHLQGIQLWFEVAQVSPALICTCSIVELWGSQISKPTILILPIANKVLCDNFLRKLIQVNLCARKNPSGVPNEIGCRGNIR